MKYIRQHIWKILLTVVLIAGIALVFREFIQDNTLRIARQNEEYLDELTVQRAVSVNSLIAENLTFIRSTAFLYGESLTSPSADIDEIRAFEENTAFDMLRFVDKNGDNHTSSGVKANLSDRPYFIAGMQGESGVTCVLQSRVTGQTQIGFYAPVRYEGEIIGVMVGFYGEAYITRLLDYELFGYEGRGWLITEDGTVLGSTSDRDADNFYDYLLSADRRHDPLPGSLLRSTLKRDGKAAFFYEDGDRLATGYAVRLEGCDWILIRTFPPSASAMILRSANEEGERMILWLVALFLLYALFMAADIIMAENRVREENKNANDVSAGVSGLFNVFITLNLPEGNYAHVKGAPLLPDIPRTGKWEELMERILTAIPEDEHREEVEKTIAPRSLRKILRTAERTSLRVHAPVNDVEWFTFNFVSLERDEEGDPVRIMLICQDVSELRRREADAQRKLEEALSAAEEASRAKTEFLFNMSHDLRTPMNAIVGYTELAGREGVPTEDMREFIRKIDSSSRRLLDLINDILEMSRIESGKIVLEEVPTDLAALIRETGELFAAQMNGKGIDFKAASDGLADPWVMCDGRRLDRILLNLVSNACKFTPAGGKVSLSLAETEGPGEDGLAAYEIRVKDTGIGMSPAFLEKVFMPFERERTSTVSGIQGTGLGLSITKKLTDLMGGKIAVNSRQGEGTEFILTLTLPVTEPLRQADDADGIPGEQGKVDFTGRRLLLAEDNEINREIAVMILTDAGFEMETAENGQQAVNMVRCREAGYYDAVLMDIQMPVMDGYTAAGAIRALEDRKKAAVPIVAMTANAFRVDVEAALAAGMNGHIAKPLEVASMMNTLREVLKNPPAAPKN